MKGKMRCWPALAPPLKMDHQRTTPSLPPRSAPSLTPRAYRSWGRNGGSSSRKEEARARILPGSRSVPNRGPLDRGRTLTTPYPGEVVEAWVEGVLTVPATLCFARHDCVQAGRPRGGSRASKRAWGSEKGTRALRDELTDGSGGLAGVDAEGVPHDGPVGEGQPSEIRVRGRTLLGCGVPGFFAGLWRGGALVSVHGAGATRARRGGARCHHPKPFCRVSLRESS